MMYINGKTRYYDPEIGQFISPDYSCLNPYAIGGLNPYSLESAFGVSNPLQVSPNRANIFPSLPLVAEDSGGDSSGSSFNWGKDWWKIALGGVIIVGLGVATVLTGGAASVILAGAFIGAVGGAAGATISTAISGDWGNFGNSFLLGTAFGGISGAVGGTALGVGWQIGINSALGVANYAASSLMNGDKMTFGGLMFNAITGGIAGWIGGAGMMHGNTMASAFAAFGGRNFFTTLGANFGKALAIDLSKEIINSLVIGGAIDGAYTRWLQERFNPDSVFWGW